MDSIIAGIYYNEKLADTLAKKGTSSDITLYNRKSDKKIYTFILPHSYPEKIATLLQTAQVTDIAILSVDRITPELGETLLILNETKPKYLYIIKSLLTDEQKLNSILKQTTLNPIYTTEDEISEILENLKPETKTEETTEIIIDHSFQVKSVGTVALALLKSGTIRPYDKLTSYPKNKEALIKSIQMQSKAAETATAPARVGLSLKGVELDDLSRGSILTDKKETPVTEATLTIEKCPFYKKPISAGEKISVSSGMQFQEATIKTIDNNTITLSFQKSIVLSPPILLIENKKEPQRLIGTATI